MTTMRAYVTRVKKFLAVVVLLGHMLAPVAARAALDKAGATASAPAAANTLMVTRAKKSVSSLINAIRFDKRDLGSKYLAFTAMAEQLLGDAAHTLSPQERVQFIADFRTLLIGTAFPKGHDMFRYLDGVLYGTAREQDGKVFLPSTLVVHRDVKKTEIKVEWVLREEDGALKVADIISMNESTCDGIRDEEVQPLLKKGGNTLLLTTLHDKAAAMSPKR